ncbi:TonB-dependent receptor [Polaromonas sp. UC242_47]|uniref:TonB-dependent receptor n=1 Tax=Polaromonas sp. UC242_47 TaxID=3374626 RepID=UPI003792AD19
MKKSFPRSAISTASLSLLALGCSLAQAQTAAPSLKEITVTGNPLGTTDLIAPATQYSGTALLLRSKTTLGETLDGTPGVSSTYFGPNASRPVIRGLDGDRIRILANGGGSLDASSLSYDHAVTSDPLSIERIEVLRGPGALLYGGSAVGGVVNVIDNRIPREAQFDEKGGISGKMDVNAASGNAERGKAALLETGTNRYSLHVDAFDRQTGDVKAPVDLACTKDGITTTARRICNSASNVSGGAVGGSVFFDHGYLGASANTYRSTYGTVAEDNVTIGMKSDRYAIEGEVRDLNGPLQSIKGQYSQTDYRHTEFEGANPGTVFKNQGSDFRLEARHARIGKLDGVLGFQTESNRFSADGAEAFAPHSKTSQSAVIAYEELGTSWGKLSAGGRLESVKVESLGNPLVPRFTPATRDFKPGSYALGALWNAAPNWQITSNLAYTERAPKDYELFANGPHIATAAYEVGNANLGKEQSGNLDVGAAWKSGGHSFKINTYVSQFKNYIALNQTPGVTRNAEDGALNPVEDPGNPGFTASGAEFKPLAQFQYEQVRARFTGIEASGNIRLREAASTLDLALRGDMVRATNLSNGLPLPRIAPWRVGASLLWASGPWGATVGFDHLAAQSRVPTPPVGETGAYTLWNTAATYRVKAGAATLQWYARLDNITNKLAYSATSVLTSTAFPKAPLPGRSLKVGLQVAF